MKRLTRYLRYILPALLLIVVTACDDDSPDPAPTAKEGRRTVLVYMIADNSLGRNGCDRADINEMLKSAAQGGITDGRLLVYHAASGADKGVNPRLIEITPDGEKTLKEYTDASSVYSVDIERVRQVLDDVDRIAPARENGLVLWSHGSGWRELPSSRSFGEDRGVTMKVSSLAKALEGRKFDFIYFDCCLMATVEVVYELRHATPTIVASGTELIDEGMRYDLNIPVFFAPELDLTVAARNTFEYYNSLVGQYRTCTMSVINTAGLDDLASATRAIMETGAKPTVSISGQQSYMTGLSTIYDMKRYIETLDCQEELKTQWNSAFDRVIAYAAATERLFGYYPIKYYGGLGTYILTAPSDAKLYNYDQQSWWKDVVSHNPNFVNK